MAGLTDLIAEIGDDNIEFQQLSQCMLGFKSSKKHGDCEVRFATGRDKIDSGKEAVVIWVDKDVFHSALAKVNT
jgi:hypothetical protein